MSILKLAKIIKTNEASVRKFQIERWRRGFGCVRCGSVRAWKHRKLKNGLQKYRCEDCKHVFSDQSTTVLRWNKLKLNQIAVVRHLSKAKLSIRDIAKEAEINKNTTERLCKKIRTLRAHFYHFNKPFQLRGIVEIDETVMKKGQWF